MTYIISIETPGRGSYTFGQIEAENKTSAQNAVADLLVNAGIARDKIGKQVTDKTTLHIGLHTIHIVPLKNFDINVASALATLLL